MYVVSLLSRFMHCCDVVHFKAAKRVLRYVKGTLNFRVKFEKAKELKLIGYSDSDWAGSIDNMKTEVEYIAAIATVNQVIWLRKLLCDLNEEQVEDTEIRVDNQTAIAIAKNPIFMAKQNHFKIKFHFVREAEQLREVNLVHCRTENQFADILTKSLGATRFDTLGRMIGVCCIQSKEKC
ncbi:hypothetical protein J1N35_046020 [Gossypium stocksii]|uniref:Copia protein n=1 Tax=Gossypium stocksii TaxID=47602 RepID=A0A9D3U5A8_9ROSI|nr:hypothetical protein J1N35_046020 [Gossypium stocksii]